MMTTKRLLDVCDFQGGTQPPKDEWINDPREGYVRMLQIRDYSQGDAKFIQYVKDTKKLHKCTKDDIMLSRYGYIGQAFIGLEGAYNVALVKVIKKAEIHTPYLLCYFQSYYFQHFLLSNVGARATIPGFNKDELENALIRIPEMCEQIEIASKITKVDKLIGFHKQQLNVLDTLIKSRFIEMFGDPETNPYGWKQLTVNDVCASIVRGPFGSALKKEFFVPPSDTTYKVYEQKHAIQKSSTIGTYYVTAEKYNELRRFECHSGDILMSCSGTMGELYQLPVGCERGIINQALCKFTLNERILPIAFLAYMRETIGNLETKGSGIQNIAAVSYVKAMPINLPPMRVQEQFAAFVEQVDKSKFYIVQMQILLRLLIRAIQQKTTEVLL